MLAQRGSRENAKGRQDAITMIPGEKPKKILTEKVITCIDEYLGKTFSCRYCKFKLKFLGFQFTILTPFSFSGITDFYGVRGNHINCCP